MPKIPAIPRISIVIPAESYGSAFEDTLVSVLANKPANCEVIVAHDGSYQDPFELGDEVRFVVADRGEMPQLIQAAAHISKARFVHVLCPGFYATEGWTDAALEKFELHDAGVVAPLIRHQADGSVVAAGWQDTSRRLGHPIAPRRNGELSSRQLAGVAGAYLHASFWRRDVLRSLTAAYDSATATINEISYAFGHMLEQAGWRCVVAEDCGVTSDSSPAQWDPGTYQRGRQLRSIRKVVTRSEKRLDIAGNLFRGLFRPSTLGETLGQMGYQGLVASTKRRLQIELVVRCDDHSVIRMPSRQAPSRRAA